MKMIRAFLAAAFLALLAIPAQAGVNNPTGVFGTANQITCTPNYGRVVCGFASPTNFSGKITVTQGTANTGIFVSTGYSLTGSDASSMIDLSGTLNTSGSPDVFALRITDTNRGASTRFFNIYGGASGTTSEFSVDNGGNIRTLGSAQIGATLSYNWSGRGALSSPAAATIQLGAADNATPVAQTLQFQNGSGTNIAAVNATINAPLATGNATNGDIIIQTGVKTGSGTAAGTKTTALTIKGETQNVVASSLIVMKGYTVSGLPTGVTGAIAYVTDATACTFLVAPTGGGSTYCPVTYNGSAWVAH